MTKEDLVYNKEEQILQQILEEPLEEEEVVKMRQKGPTDPEIFQ